MSMFCYQCQETSKNIGCTVAGMCGKSSHLAGLQDLLIHTLKGISILAEAGSIESATGKFIQKALFTTITNANFDESQFVEYIKAALIMRDELAEKYGHKIDSAHDSLTWTANDIVEMYAHASFAGILETKNEDVRSLRELLIGGLKGMAAYSQHALNLGNQNEEIYSFIVKALASTTKELTIEEMISLNMECGKFGVDVMALLDGANTDAFGQPEITKVNIGVRNNPAILISGHDLNDIEELLEQTKGTGVDVYTHCEMLPAHSYPKFKKYPHLVGNYGNAWHKQGIEFESFNGPILMTTNCIIPVKASYKERFYTTGETGWPGCTHIEEDSNGSKDYSAIIAQAKKCAAPTEIETGSVIGGFGHNQVLALSDKIIDAVKAGALKRFIVMAGCDGRHNSRKYYTEVAKKLPKDTVILTAGCAKFRYNKLDLGDIGGIPRILDAGQCNDCYSLLVIAMKLQEAFGLETLNDLPLSFDIAWYEQKSVIILLALLHLGVKGIRLGPTIPALLSPNVIKVLVENFNIKAITDADSDIAAMIQGK